jgi:hypothetical protein
MEEVVMPAKMRIQAIDPTKAFATDGDQRAEALRSQFLPRLSALMLTAVEEATNTFGFDVMKYSDDVSDLVGDEVFAGLRPSDGDFPVLRNVQVPNFVLGISGNVDNMGVILRIKGAGEWRLFVKALYQYRETLGDYVGEFEELYLLNSDGEEEAVEELDQFFAIDVDGPEFKAQGCTLYFPGLEYPIEAEEDFETLTSDFVSLFPFYWTLLKAARGETVDMDKLLNE